MTDAQKKKELKRLAGEIERIHADYAERFAKLRKKQLALLKRVNARAEELKIGELVKGINKMRKK
jgi:hypothetical protein